HSYTLHHPASPRLLTLSLHDALPIFLAIETSPILAKLLSPKGAYDLKLEEQESALKSWVVQQKTQRDVLVTTDRDINNRVYADRSEEHTSELQSRENLVCRLLLEKKK